MSTIDREPSVHRKEDEVFIQDEAGLLDLFFVLVKHKSLMLRSLVLCTLVASIIAFLLPNRYSATATVLPPMQNQSVSSAVLGQLGALANFGGKDFSLKNPSDLYIGLLKSKTMSREVIKKFDLMHVYDKKKLVDTEKKLAGFTEIETSKEGLISITVLDRDPNRAAEIANFYVEELQHLNERLAVGEAARRRAFFEQQLKGAKIDLANAEVALKEMRENTGLLEAESQSKEIIGSISNLKSQIASAEVQLQKMRLFATEENPDLKSKEQELIGLRRQLAILLQKSGAGHGDIQISTERLPAMGLDYVRKTRDVKFYEGIYEFLGKQFESAKIDEAKEGNIVQQVDFATPPEKKASPPRIWIILGGLFGSIALTAFAIFLLEGMKRVSSSHAWSSFKDQVQARSEL